MRVHILKVDLIDLIINALGKTRKPTEHIRIVKRAVVSPKYIILLKRYIFHIRILNILENNFIMNKTIFTHI